MGLLTFLAFGLFFIIGMCVGVAMQTQHNSLSGDSFVEEKMQRDGWSL